MSDGTKKKTSLPPVGIDRDKLPDIPKDSEGISLERLPFEEFSTDELPAREVTDRINISELEGLRNIRKESETKAYLIVRRPDYSKVQVPLERETTIIGRSVSCDIVIKDDKASREHARVSRVGSGSYELEDLSSRNGTWSDGVQVSKMRLMNGDSFSVGNAVFTLRVEHAHAIADH